MRTSTEFLLGMFVAFLLVTLFMVLLKRAAKDLGTVDWRKQCSQAEHVRDQWRSLFERQRFIDDLNPAAQRQEQFDVDRRARVLGLDVKETRRVQP